MKKIGIDARLYTQTGVGTYLRNLLNYLPASHPQSTKFFVYLLSKDVRAIDIPNDQFVIRGVDAPWHTIREQTVFYQALMHDRLDLMHFTYFSYPVLYKRPFIATVHDVTPILFKTGKASTLNPILFEMKHLAFRFVLSQQVKNAKKIITPTGAVKNQLIEIYGRKVEDKIAPIYEGVSVELMKAQANEGLSKKTPQSFFLYVGNFYPHKNVDRLLEAFKLFSLNTKTQQNNNPVHLILVGPDNIFAHKLKQKMKKENINNMQFDHCAGNEELVYYYHNARALINPSLSEGFGLPLIEAAYYNCPVIASDIPVFKEILGGNYISFNPEKVNDLIEKMGAVPISISKEIKSELFEKYSFETMTQETVDLYHTLI